MVDIGTVIALIKALGSGGGGGGGTTDYDDLTDKPQINGVTLAGNKLGSALGLADLDAIAPNYPDLTFPVSAGQLCTHDGGLYEANDDISTSEEWTAAHWTSRTVAAILAALVSDVKVNGISVVANGAANVPIASTSAPGVVRPYSAGGISINTAGQLFLYAPTDADIKSGDTDYKAIMPKKQHISAFYGLAKAAGDTTQSASANDVGTYTENALSKIHDMIDAPVSVSGSTPEIVAKSGVRYICGEVSTLSITVPESGIIDVVFTSGSTPTALTIVPPSGLTMKWANNFNPLNLASDTTYEINIMNGIYGVVASWT